MPLDPSPATKTGGAYLIALVMILLAFLFLGVLFGGYMLTACGLVWYAARPKTG